MYNAAFTINNYILFSPVSAYVQSEESQLEAKWEMFGMKTCTS